MASTFLATCGDNTLVLSNIAFNVNNALLQPAGTAGSRLPSCDVVFTGVVSSKDAASKGRGNVNVTISWGDDPTHENDTVLLNLEPGAEILVNHTYAAPQTEKFAVAICVVDESNGKACDTTCSQFKNEGAGFIQPIACKLACAQCPSTPDVKVDDGACRHSAGACVLCTPEDERLKKCKRHPCPAECGQFSCGCEAKASCSTPSLCAERLNRCRPFANCPGTSPPIPCIINEETGEQSDSCPYFTDCTEN
jgi:hypothetical protein